MIPFELLMSSEVEMAEVVSDSSTSKPPSWRGLPRRRTAAMLVVLLAAAAILVVGYPVLNERFAVDLLRQSGGRVEGESNGVVFSATRVELFAVDGADCLVKSLDSLPMVTSLDLGYSDLSATGLSFVSGLSGVKVLSLEGVDHGDEDLIVIANMKGLESLDLHTTRVTCDGARRLLRECKQLKHLALSRNLLRHWGPLSPEVAEVAKFSEESKHNPFGLARKPRERGESFADPNVLFPPGLGPRARTKGCH